MSGKKKLSSSCRGVMLLVVALSAAWVLIVLFFAPREILPPRAESNHAKAGRSAVDSGEAPNVTALVDPFFTNTPRRMRLCRSGHSSGRRNIDNSFKIKLIFVEETSTDVSTNHFYEIIKFNLIQSLKKNKFDNITFLPVTQNSSFYEKAHAIVHHLKNWKKKKLYTHLVLATSMHIIFGSSPAQLIAQLDSSTNLIFSSSEENDISIEPLFSFGKLNYLENFFGYFLSKFENSQAKDGLSSDAVSVGTLSSVLLKRKRLWKIRLDNTGRTMGTTISENAADKHPKSRSFFWIAKASERADEQGGSGLGRGYCLVSRKFSGSCSHAINQPDVLIFMPSISHVEGYNFLSSHYLSIAPLNQKFSTKYKRKDFRVVVSFTSLPRRLPNIHRSLDSLFSQHVKPDIIYMNIPKTYSRFKASADEKIMVQLKSSFNNKYGIPFVINKIEKDVGPLAKLLPTLHIEKNPKTIIITVDDDMIFKPTLLGILLQRHLNNPGYAYGVSGQLIDIDPDYSIHVRTAWKWKDGDYAVDIIEGFTGAVYRRDFFDESSLSDVPPQCTYTDDIWISAHLAMKGIPRIKLALGWGDTAEFSENDNINPLRDDNLNGTKRNDVCASLLIESFQKSWVREEEYCSFDFTPLPNI